MPHCNDAGLSLICAEEGLRLRSSPDPGTGAEPWTIGYGHTAHVYPGQMITPAQVLAFLKSDVTNAEMAVAHTVDVTLTPNQFSALVPWQYNTGALAGSTLLHCINRKDWPGAIAQFGRWIYAGGDILPGLVARRAAEPHLFSLPGLCLLRKISLPSSASLRGWAAHRRCRRAVTQSTYLLRAWGRKAVAVVSIGSFAAGLLLRTRTSNANAAAAATTCEVPHA